MTPLSMITQDLALGAASPSSLQPRPRPAVREQPGAFQQAIDDQRRQAEGSKKDDLKPATPVSESAEATKAEPQEQSEASKLRQGESKDQPQADASDARGGDADKGGEHAQDGGSSSERRSEGSAQAVAGVAQRAQDSAQNLPSRQPTSPSTGESVHHRAQNAPQVVQSADGEARLASDIRIAADGVRASAPIDSVAGQPANGAGSGTASQGDAQTATGRPDSQVVTIDGAPRGAGSENAGHDDPRRRSEHHVVRQANSAADASAHARAAEPASSRDERMSPDALTQLRNLIQKTAAEGGRAQREPQALTPAGARTVQVEASLQVESLTGQQATTEVQAASRDGAPSPSPALNHSSGVGSKSGGGDAALPVRSSADENLFSERIVRGLSAMVNQRGGVMNMKLHPAELGALRVQMSVVQGAVTAHFVASTAEAQTMLDRSMGVLRAALESHGLHVERISVSHAPADSSGTSTRHDAQDQQNQPSPGRDHDAGKGESRGRHDGQRQSGHDRRGGDPSEFEDFRSFEAAFDSGDGAGTGGDS